uniref:Uncharacterized protein n=1 Tax=Setaria viridis TaxID=4556 RepID=A0A4U6UGS5_SETVI|nr:hypothetical protein SEVIR_5G229200v2 [Setaria viridis]
MPTASHASTCSPNPHGIPSPRPPDRPEAPNARRPRPITAEDHPELCLLCPMAPLANGRLARALAAPSLILSPPEPRLDPPPHHGPIKETPLTGNTTPLPPPAPAQLLSPLSHRFLLCAAAELPSSATAGVPSKPRRRPSLSAYDLPPKSTPFRPQGFTGRPGGKPLTPFVSVRPTPFVSVRPTPFCSVRLTALCSVRSTPFCSVARPLFFSCHPIPFLFVSPDPVSFADPSPPRLRARLYLFL